MVDLTFLVQALVIVTVPFAVSRVLRLTSVVPLVVIQILLGIALGPSVFGRFAPDTFHLLFNPATLARLSGAASIAVLFFCFITGLHLKIDTFRGRGRAFTAMAIASVAVPTFLGLLGGLWIAARYPAEVGARANPVQFAVAIGICVGVTALPVLGAILRETGLLGRRLGDLALAIAAVNDAALWLLLGGLMMAVAGREPDAPNIFLTLAVLPAYLAFMAGVLPRWLKGMVAKRKRDGTLSEAGLVAICGIVIGSGMVTQLMGLHYLFGAFIAGAVMPHELRESILERLQFMTVGVLMPIFFMLTGLNTLIDLGSTTFLEIFLLTTTLAVLGKIGGTTIAALLVGERLPFALSLGALVQTKGLMEVIILTIMLDRQIISGTVFSALTGMALFTTALATPLLRVALHKTPRDVTAAQRLPQT